MDIQSLHQHIDIVESNRAHPEQISESARLINQWERDIKPDQIWEKRNSSEVAADIISVDQQNKNITLRIQEFGPNGLWYHRHTRRLNRGFFAKWRRIL